MKALKVTLEVHWGLSINYFFGTKSRPPLRVIPPTTLIGALAYPIARMMNFPEVINGQSSAEKIKKMIKGVYYTIEEEYDPFIPYGENTKLVFYKVREKMIKTDAAPLPRLYSTIPVTITIIYLIDEEKAREILGDEWEKILLVSAASMIRLGARESIISVYSVGLHDARIRENTNGFIRTRYTIPLDSVKPMKISGNYRVAKIIDWRRTSIGDYVNKPTTLIAQPIPGPTGSEVTIEEPITYIDVDGEALVPWFIAVEEVAYT